MDFNDYKEELEVLEDMRQSYSLLFIALNKIQAEADSKIKDITLRQLMLLVAIAHLDKSEASIVNIAHILGTSKQNVTRLVNSMIKSGYLLSTPSAIDKRSVNISLTEKGVCTLKDNSVRANRYFLDIFHNFSREELKSFHNSLKKIANYDDSLEKHFEDPIKVNAENNSIIDLENFLKTIRKSNFFNNN